MLSSLKLINLMNVSAFHGWNVANVGGTIRLHKDIEKDMEDHQKDVNAHVIQYYCAVPGKDKQITKGFTNERQHSTYMGNCVGDGCGNGVGGGYGSGNGVGCGYGCRNGNGSGNGSGNGNGNGNCSGNWQWQW